MRLKAKRQVPMADAGKLVLEFDHSRPQPLGVAHVRHAISSERDHLKTRRLALSGGLATVRGW